LPSQLVFMAGPSLSPILPRRMHQIQCRWEEKDGEAMGWELLWSCHQKVDSWEYGITHLPVWVCAFVYKPIKQIIEIYI
jgi:hypothetical protein